MKRLIGSELLKLRTTRSTLAMSAGALALGALVGAGNVATAGIDGAAALGSPSFVANVVGVSTIPALVALLLGVLLAAGEYQHQTITTTFLVAPKRWTVVVAKSVAGAAGGLAMGAGMVGAASAAAFAGVATKGGSIDAFDRSVAVSLAGLLLASATLGVMGVFLGLAVRSQVVAVVAVAVWVLVLEGIVDVVTGGGLRAWLPGGAAADLAGAGGRPMWSAALLVWAWTAVMGVAALALLTRRDVS